MTSFLLYFAPPSTKTQGIASEVWQRKEVYEPPRGLVTCTPTKKQVKRRCPISLDMRWLSPKTLIIGIWVLRPMHPSTDNPTTGNDIGGTRASYAIIRPSGG